MNFANGLFIAVLYFVKFFVFLFILILGLQSWAVDSVGSCQQLFSDEYQPTDFAQSYMGKHFDNQGQYPKWAAVVARFSLDLLQKGRTFEDVFEQIAMHRGRRHFTSGFGSVALRTLSKK